MIKKTISFMLAALSVVMLAGCGNSQTSDAASDNAAIAASGAVAASDSAGDANTSSNALYTVSSDGKYTFNTSKFDPKKFSGKIYINNTALNLPLTYEELAKANLYVGEVSWFTSDEGYESKFADSYLNAEAHRAEYLVRKTADSEPERFGGFGTMLLYNPTKEKLSYPQCQIGRLDTSGVTSTRLNAFIMFYGDEKGKQLNKNGRFTIDTAMELFGAPAVVSSSGTELIYPYENYVIVVANTNSDNADLIFIYSWDYLKKEVKDTLYDIIPAQYRYNH